MASGLTNEGKRLLLEGIGWGEDGPLQCELLTSTYDELQIAGALHRSELDTPSGMGTYTPLGAPPLEELYSSPAGNRFLDITDGSGSNLTWQNLDTGGTAVRGYALCGESKVLLIHEFPQFVPNGDNFTFVFNSGIIARMVVQGQPSVGFLVDSLLGNAPPNPRTGQVVAYLYREVSTSTNLLNWDYDPDSERILPPIELVTAGKKVSLKIDQPLTWEGYFPPDENPTPFMGVVFSCENYIISHVEFEFAVPSPVAGTLTYTMDHLLCLN